MFEEFYEMYEPEEQEVVALINRCIGSASIWKKAKRLSCWNVEDEPVPPVGRRKVGSQSWISK